MQKKARENQKIEKVKRLTAYFTHLHAIYCIDGFDAVKQTGYPYSQDAVTKQFAKYVSSFVPQNGKIRGNRKKRKTIKGL